jgi:hypothetical protein
MSFLLGCAPSLDPLPSRCFNRAASTPPPFTTETIRRPSKTSMLM